MTTPAKGPVSLAETLAETLAERRTERLFEKMGAKPMSERGQKLVEDLANVAFDAYELGATQEPHMKLINELLKEEGTALTLVAQNADGNGPDNDVVVLCSAATGWVDKSFFGHNMLECLTKASRVPDARA